MQTPPHNTWRMIPSEKQRIVPWRNGEGETRQIAIEPPDATAASAFAWRISSAKITAKSPFSTFPNIDRSLWLLQGSGLLLFIAGQEVRLEKQFARVDFAGEAEVKCELLGGAVCDLNLMVDRTRYRAAATVVQNEQHEMRGAATVLVVALSEVTLLCDKALGQQRFALQAFDALRVELQAQQQTRIAAQGAVLCVQICAVS
ncbi:MAG: HutD family protein [Planctomycetes bacterium]|nr:HutD family protein [Planctomycetota bacterium]